MNRSMLAALALPVAVIAAPAHAVTFTSSAGVAGAQSFFLDQTLASASFTNTLTGTSSSYSFTDTYTFDYAPGFKANGQASTTAILKTIKPKSGPATTYTTKDITFTSFSLNGSTFTFEPSTPGSLTDTVSFENVLVNPTGNVLTITGTVSTQVPKASQTAADRSASYSGTLEFASSVPEPASWAMMIGGFGMVGGTLRRRKMVVRFAKA